MKPSPSLREIQLWMRSIITRPQAVAPSEILTTIVDPPEFSRVQRLDVYAKGYFMRILEALEQDFPATKNLLGDRFARVCASYLQVFPSNSPNIEDVGDRLPSYLRTCALTADEGWLHELADLEWAKKESLFAPDTRQVDLSIYSSKSAADWLGARLLLRSSAKVFAFSYPIDRLLATNARPLPAEATYLLLQRRDDRPSVRRLEADEYAALEAIQSGKTLAEALAVLAESSPEQVMKWFSDWVQTGVIADVRFDASGNQGQLNDFWKLSPL